MTRKQSHTTEKEKTLIPVVNNLPDYEYDPVFVKKAEEAYLFCERAESAKAYGLVKHRHLAEAVLCQKSRLLVLTLAEVHANDLSVQTEQREHELRSVRMSGDGGVIQAERLG